MEAVVKKPVVKKPVAKPHAVKKPHAPKEHVVKHAAKEEAMAVNVVPHVPKIPHGQHFYAVGRRKTAVAQAQISQGNGTITVNKLSLEGYFQTPDLRQIVIHPLSSVGLDKTINVRAKVHGGGIHSQAESLRHAISRALIELNPESRRTLKKLGFLTRDPRVKERKKPGLKRARRAPQFSKR